MRGRVAALLLPGLLFAALHLRALDYDFVWVDQAEIVAGTILRPPGKILAAFGEPLQRSEGFATRTFSQPYYRPLQVVLASALDAAFGRTPRTFRSASLLLGTATAGLFGLLALGLLRQPAAAVLAGAVFAAHPGLLEIYVWVAGLSAALMGFFAIASLGCGWAAQGAGTLRTRVAWCAGSLAALAAGLLSKENAAVVPALQIVLAAAALRRARTAHEPRPSVPTLAALVAAQSGLALLYLFALRPAVLGTALTGASPIGGSLAAQWQTSLAAWPAQLLWLFAPLHSSTSDAVRIATGWGDPATLCGIALALGSAAAILRLLRRGHAVAAAALAWIWIGFLPTSGVAPLLQARAERNLFLSIFGAALLWGSALAALRRTPVRRAFAAVLAALVVGTLSERTWARTPDWRSTEALFGRDVADDPRHREGRINLIVADLSAGRIDDAKRHVDILADQKPEQEGWHSYVLEPNLRELVCVVNAAAHDDADTLRRYPPHVPSRSEVWLAPGFHACYAAALERLAHCEEALAIYAALYRGSGAEGLPFARGALRCATALGRADAVRDWRARIAADAERARGTAK
jgi:hypothetical protein